MERKSYLEHVTGRQKEAAKRLEVEARTEYRIVTNRTRIADRYLQFKSNLKKRNFPDFWNKRIVEVWRYIPTEETHIFNYLSEEDCPKVISYGEAGRLVNCFHGQEDFEYSGITPFTKKFPDIQVYFAHFNSLRDKYLAKEKAALSAGTTLLSDNNQLEAVISQQLIASPIPSLERLPLIVSPKTNRRISDEQLEEEIKRAQELLKRAERLRTENQK